MSRLGLSLVQTPWTPTTTIIWCLWVEIVMECWLLGFISKFEYLFTEVIKAMVVFIYHNCMFNFVLNKISTLVALIYFRMHRTLFLSLDNGHANVLMTKWTEMWLAKQPMWNLRCDIHCSARTLQKIKNYWQVFQGSVQ